MESLHYLSGVTGGAGNTSGGYVVCDAHPGGVVLDLIITPQLRLISCASDGVIRVWDIRRIIYLQRITLVVLREAYKKQRTKSVCRENDGQVYKKDKYEKEMEGIRAGKQSLSHYFRYIYTCMSVHTLSPALPPLPILLILILLYMILACSIGIGTTA